MDAQAMQALLDSLIECWENEVVEFKRAGNDYSTDACNTLGSARNYA
jgi:ATP-dependent DNA helicase RecG